MSRSLGAERALPLFECWLARFREVLKSARFASDAMRTAHNRDLSGSGPRNGAGGRSGTQFELQKKLRAEQITLNQIQDLTA